MSNDFLRAYTIPILQKNTNENEKVEESNALPLIEHTNPENNFKETNDLAFNNLISRYIAPGKQIPEQPVSESTIPRPPKRKLTDNSNQSSPPKFVGYDSSYREELKKLIKPLFCELCKVQVNSPKSARDHYESKAHDRRINIWIAEHFPEVEKPIVNRLLKDGPSGPNVIHCEDCDLALTSLAHAKQHYAGRKHFLVVNKRSTPSGAGYYNTEGKWIRTGTKLTTGNKEDQRFDIGILFLNTEDSNPQQLNEKPNTEVTTDNLLCCEICKISVTSASQMDDHLLGAKHKKKLVQCSQDPNAIISTPKNGTLNKDSILASLNVKKNTTEDFSMFRTPTGSYYCQICNMTMDHIPALQQHIQGKKHTKKTNEQKTNQNQIKNK